MFSGRQSYGQIGIKLREIEPNQAASIVCGAAWPCSVKRWRYPAGQRSSVRLAAGAPGQGAGSGEAMPSTVTEIRRPSACMTLVSVSRVGLPRLESER